jgi:hypothetical protein
VQDVVTGLTLVFLDLLDIDDRVEIGGQAGLVRSIGMRFIFRQELVKSMQGIRPECTDWVVSDLYETEKKPGGTIRRGRLLG